MPKIAKITTTLNDSMKRNAWRLKMPEEQYKQHLINRVTEMRVNRKSNWARDKSPKKYTLSGNRPVLVVGAAPSWRDNIEQIKNFPGKVIVVDILFNEIIKLGVEPDYVVSLEANMFHKIQRPFDAEFVAKMDKKPAFIGSMWTQSKTVNFIAVHGMKFNIWKFGEEPRVSNVGLFGIVYAYYKLKADRIILLGMEHEGEPYHQSIYDYWMTDFYYFIKKMPSGTIVNCSGGALYGKDITDSDLKRVKWAGN